MSKSKLLPSQAQILADFADISHQTVSGGIIRDPELLKRVYERSAKVRQEALAKFGVQDIGVHIIREMRERE